MDRDDLMRHPGLAALVKRLAASLGPRLVSVVVYGSAARDDFRGETSDLNVLLVLADLEPATLAAAAPAVRRWLKARRPMPRLFTPSSLADSCDVFPIELLDLAAHRVVVHGVDPLPKVTADPALLRLQCERELREKMMRLREGYLEAHGSGRRLSRLLAESFTTFAAILRGGLHLLGGTPPSTAVEVFAAFCAATGLDPAPFAAVAALRAGGGADPETVFAGYYAELQRVVRAVDRFETKSEQGGAE